MNRTDFEKLARETIESTAQLLITKGAEYAGDADRLANFKRGAGLIGVTPLQVALIYASKHFDAISTYVRNDAQGKMQILSEPIEGRFDDLINYCILMKALVAEQGTPLVTETLPLSQSEIDRIAMSMWEKQAPIDTTGPLKGPL
jgi:hypothetical protein